jgi:hypothetical protein
MSNSNVQITSDGLQIGGFDKQVESARDAGLLPEGWYLAVVDEVQPWIKEKESGLATFSFAVDFLVLPYKDAQEWHLPEGKQPIKRRSWFWYGYVDNGQLVPPEQGYNQMGVSLLSALGANQPNVSFRYAEQSGKQVYVLIRHEEDHRGGVDDFGNPVVYANVSRVRPYTKDGQVAPKLESYSQHQTTPANDDDMEF